MTDQTSTLRDRAAATVSHISLMSRPYGAPRIHMDEDASSAPASEPTVIHAPADAGASISLADAARTLVSARNPKKATRTSALAPTGEKFNDMDAADQALDDPLNRDPDELSEQDNAAPDHQATGETQETDPPEEAPLDLPRSWTKEQAEHWKALPRATQEYLIAQDSKASAEVRRVQNEAAEKLKGLTAKEQQTEQARQQLESRTRAALQVLEREQLRDFPDIRNMDDVRKLSLTDPLRYLQWDAHQKEMVAAHNAVQEADGRKAHEKQTERKTYAEAQDKLLQDLVPEMKDPAKATEMRTRAVAMLIENGFTNDELAATMKSDDGFKLLTDARFQKIIADALKLSDIMKAKKTAIRQPVPPVQRPGTARPSGNAGSERIQALDRQLNATGSLKAAQELRAAQVAARTRRPS